MININGIDYYTANEITDYLCMKYSSVIFLLRKNNIQKYGNKYIITKEQVEQLKNRDNQYVKIFHLNEDELMYEKKRMK